MKKNIGNMSFKAKLNLLYVICIIGSFIIIFGATISKPYTLHPVAWLGIAVMVAGMVFRFRYIKCPSCGYKLFNSRQRNCLKRCSNCGAKLQ